MSRYVQSADGHGSSLSNAIITPAEVMALKKRRKPKLSEAHFERQVRDYLEKVEGWRCFHFEQIWSDERKKTFGEAGMPDLLCIRYHDVDKWLEDHYRYASTVTFARSRTQVMWIELKRPGGKARANQKLWHLHERKLGALTVIAGEDFEADIDSFMVWYASWGPRRRA